MPHSSSRLKTLSDELNLLTDILKSYKEPSSQNSRQNMNFQNVPSSSRASNFNGFGRTYFHNTRSIYRYNALPSQPPLSTKSNSMQYRKNNMVIQNSLPSSNPRPNLVKRSAHKFDGLCVDKTKEISVASGPTISLSKVTENLKPTPEEMSKNKRSVLVTQDAPIVSTRSASATPVTQCIPAKSITNSMNGFIERDEQIKDLRKKDKKLESKSYMAISNLDKRLTRALANDISMTTKAVPSGPKRVVTSKYKVVNKNASISSVSRRISPESKVTKKITTPQSMKKVMQTKYKIVNKKKSPKSLSTKQLQCKGKIGQFSYNTAGGSKCLAAEKELSKEDALNLSNMSPEELVALDHVAILKLSSMVKSDEDKKDTFVKKTDYKIISKQNLEKKQRKSWGLNNHIMFKNTQSHTILKNSVGNRACTPVARKLQQKYPKMVKFRGTNYNRLSMKLTRAQPVVLRKKGKANKKVVTVRGVKFSMDSSGKSLRKLSLDGSKKTLLNPVSGESSPASKVRIVASKVLHRSIQTAAAAKAKKSQGNPYCMFYNRFGKCNRQADCPYIHDPRKIAVCTRFLRGTCKTKSCPFSHERNPGKMAICSFYLQGCCKEEECPYRHEKLAPNTALCQDFTCGYCPLANKCPKAHILVCPDYFRGECSKGASCPYPHPPRKERLLEKLEKIPNTPMDLSDAMPTETTTVEEQRYFSSSKSVSKGSEDKLVIGRAGWVNGTVPTLPKYIPLKFNDADCLMK